MPSKPGPQWRAFAEQIKGQTVYVDIEVKEEKSEKTKLYWIVGDVSKAYHADNLCSASKKITVTGEVKEEEGTMKIAATKIVDAK